MQFGVRSLPALEGEQDTVGVGETGSWLLKVGGGAVTTVAGCSSRSSFGSGVTIVIPKGYPANGDVTPIWNTALVFGYTCGGWHRAGWTGW